MELSSLIWLLYFQEVTFHARKMKNPTLKKFLIFREMELSSFNPEKKKPRCRKCARSLHPP